jgi:hypothetical protein
VLTSPLNLIIPAPGGGFLAVICTVSCDLTVFDTGTPSHGATTRHGDGIELIKTQPPIPLSEEDLRWLEEYPP